MFEKRIKFLEMTNGLLRKKAQYLRDKQREEAAKDVEMSIEGNKLCINSFKKI